MKRRLKILVTAGSTDVPIDRVRSLSNIFHGKTGATIAFFLGKAGAEVTLLTSDKRIIGQEAAEFMDSFGGRIRNFRTYDELLQEMEEEIKNHHYDVVIHSAAVSDYQASEVCVMRDGKLCPIDRDKKISSSHQDLYLHLTPTQKIIGLIRKPWNFKGYLIKFKLQVEISDEELLTIARKSRTDSQADVIVANCLEWAKERAYVISDNDELNVSRKALPFAILGKIKEEVK